MVSKFSVITILLSIHTTIFAQDKGDIIVGAYTDLIKTDNVTYFSKAQLGLEGNYFLNEVFTATVGFELWTPKNVSFVFGTRWYPVEEAFVRVRGLIGENDLSMGGGWAKPLSPNLKLEAIGDFYFSVDFSIRAGIVYVIP